MKRLFAFVFLFSLFSVAQSQIPVGTILPVQLSTAIDSRKASPGEQISARLMQEVDLGNRLKLRAGARIQGRIVSVDVYRVTFTFDQALLNHERVPLRTSLRALASMMDVQEAQLPTNNAGGDRGSSIQDWTTEPIGGGALYNPYGGELFEGNRPVGRSRNGGIIAQPVAVFGTKCRGDLGKGADQAFWVFSPSACGIYGMELDVVHAGRSDPVGLITLQSHQRFVIRSGSSLLLRVLP